MVSEVNEIPLRAAGCGISNHLTFIHYFFNKIHEPGGDFTILV